MSFALEARGLRIERGGRVLVDVPSFGLPPGRVVALIGPNGAGKTTLLTHLALLERPTAGEVLFGGQPSRGHELALRRRMAVVFQEPLLLDRTARANVETGLRLRGVPRGERRARAEHWLARFGVGAMTERSPRTLSGGEAQRVSLARAFALQPEVLLLDEPFTALDRPTRDAITDDLALALRETGITALIVTHDRDEAARLGNEVAVMIGGRIRQSGAPASVFGAPADEDVAAFVGVETMVPATVTGDADGLLTLDAAGHAIEAIAPPGETPPDVLVCLRPEDVSVAPLGGGTTPGSARNHLAGTVTRVKASGADARIEIDCGFRLTARVTRRSADELGLAPGMRVVASFKATAVHLIPKG